MNKILMMFAIIALASCSSNDDGDGIVVGGPTGGGSTPLYLKDHANFPIGSALSMSEINSAANSTNETLKDVVENDYNSITAGNEMKMYNMFPAADTYDWSDGDAYVAYAKANGMRIHGHTLIWHPSYAIPDWLENFSGTDTEFENQVKNYIINTVAHFAEETDDNGNPIVESWDVVNEAFTGDAEAAVFRQRIGEDYVAKCFQWARLGDPNVKLFYNDYNIAGDPGKRISIINMVNEFISNGIPIDGVGMQMHVNHDWPNATELENAIQDIANTGLLVHISELDVKVNYNNDVTELTDQRAQAQSEMYQRVAYLYETIVPSSKQHGITIWGLRDQDSWLYDGNTEWPLIYDSNYDPKPAYDGFTEGLKGIAP